MLGCCSSGYGCWGAAAVAMGVGVLQQWLWVLGCCSSGYGCWGAAAVAMGVGVLQQWRPFLSSLVAFPPTQVQDHLWNIQLPRPSLSESQLQSHSVQVNLTVRPSPVPSAASLLDFLGFVNLVL